MLDLLPVRFAAALILALSLAAGSAGSGHAAKVVTETPPPASEPAVMDDEMEGPGEEPAELSEEGLPSEEGDEPGVPAADQAAAKPAWPAWLAESAPDSLQYLETQRANAESADPVTLAERRVSVRELLAAGNQWDARYTLERIIADAPDDYAAWVLLGLSISYRGEEEDLVRRAAAYHAWRTATDDVERALALWIGREVAGEPLAVEKQSLALADRSAIEARIDDLKTNYPAEFIPLRSEGLANASGGSACVSFTHPLVRPRISRYNDFVEVTPHLNDLAVTASGRRLCVDGIPFGQSVTLTLRAGLPGIGARKLERVARFDIAVPQRAVTLRFRERGYVLLSQGPQLVPLESVNIEKARVRVYRIVERNLIAALQSEFPAQQREWQVSNLAYGDAEPVFDGEVALGGEPNRTVTTGLAVSEMVGGPLLPGVYLIAVGPVGVSEERGNFVVDTTQWLMVSDIGLNLMQGPDGLHVFTRSLAGATALPGVEVTLVAQSNRVLASAKTDASGHALFERPVVQGNAGAAPLYVRAEAPTLGFTFLPFAQGAFDLSDRGIAGRDDPGAVDGFVFAERGAYRPGETVHLTALLRSGSGEALAGLPLTLKLERPDGIEVTRTTQTDRGAGGYGADFALAPDSMTGQWTVSALLDPAQPAVGRATFVVEDFVPPTIEVKAATGAPSAAPNQPIAVNVQADYFFGAPAGALRVDARATLRAAETPYVGYDGYRFGLEEEPWSPRLVLLGSAETDKAGAAPLGATIALAPDTTHPLEAEIAVSVFEVSGRPVTTTLVVPFHHQPVALGLKPGFADANVGDGAPANFDVVALAPEGTPLARPGIAYTLYREDWSYVWFKRYNSWDYEVSVNDNPIARGTLDLKPEAPSALSFDVDWGRYRLEITDPQSGAATSYRFTSGWWVAPGSEGRPDLVHVTLDKTGYKAGDLAQVHVEPPYAGQLVLMRAGATLEVVHSGPIEEGGATIPINLGPNWLAGPGAYVLAAVYRPGQDLSIAMPARALGIAWLAADPERRDIKLGIDVPTQMRPGTPLAVTLKADEGTRSAYAVVAAVDEAVLGVTGYETPDPLGYVMVQRKLGYDIRDTYGRLIDPRDAPRGVLRTGGDAIGGLDTSLAVRSTRIVSLFSGIIAFDTNGQASVTLDVPDFAGRLRVMAVAWSADRLGHAQADVTVRDPVVASLSLPRFLAPGDTAETAIGLENLDAPAGDYTVSLTTSGPLEATLGQGGKATLASGGRAVLPVSLKGTAAGVAALTLTLDGPEGLHIERRYDLAVRPTVNRVRRSTLLALAPGQSYVVPGGLMDGLVEGSGLVRLSLGVAPDFGAAGLVGDLYDYPYRCLEQSSSRAMGLLVGSKWKIGSADEIDATIARIVALQRYDGSFGLWSSRADAEPWLSAFASDVLVRARAAGHRVPDVPYDNALTWLANSVAQPGQSASELSALAYAHYVLALAGKADLGRLRHFATTNLEALPAPMDAALIGAALARFGERDLAVSAFGRATSGTWAAADGDWYGSEIRERAAVIALIAETDVLDDRLPALIETLRGMAGPREHFSTQEEVWMVRAAATLDARNKGEATVRFGAEAKTFVGSLVERLSDAQAKSGLVVTNDGTQALFGMLESVGVPLTPPPPTERGIAIERQILTLDGGALGQTALKHGDLVVVRLSGRVTSPGNHQVLLVDLLPAGLEIENPRLGGEDIAKTMPWLNALSVVEHVAARDDRFVAALRLAGESGFEVAYLARAVTPGTFNLPAPYGESMYRADVFGIGAAGMLSVVR